MNSITLVTSTPAQSIFLLAIGRALTLLIVIPILVLVFHLRPPSALLIHWDLAVPAFVAVAGNAAFLAYYALVAGGQVTVLAPMVRERGCMCVHCATAHCNAPHHIRCHFASYCVYPFCSIGLHNSSTLGMHYFSTVFALVNHKLYLFCSAFPLPLIFFAPYSIPFSMQVGLYSVIPVTAGLVFRGEDRTWPKLTGA